MLRIAVLVALLAIFAGVWYGETRRQKAVIESLTRATESVQIQSETAVRVNAQAQAEKAAALDSVRPAHTKVRRYLNGKSERVRVPPEGGSVPEIPKAAVADPAVPDAPEWSRVFNEAIAASNAAVASASGVPRSVQEHSRARE